MNEWMKGLNDQKKLVQLCLPGSHDAGVYRDEKNGVNPGTSTRCQYSEIWKQALAGSRVFDIRCFLRTTGIINKEKTPTMGHFFKEGKDGYFGDYGGTLMSALEDAGLFLQNNRSEFLIFRIGHTKCTGNVVDALEQFQKKQDSANTLKYPGLIHTGWNGNLADLVVQQLRGKILLVFDKEFNSPGFNPQKGYYPYYKYTGGPINSGLSFCGKYSGGLKTKLALKSEDKGNWSAQGAVELAKAAVLEHQNHGSDHLLWIYWQETGGNVEKNTGAPEGMRDRLDSFLNDMRQARIKDPAKKVVPNVIGHDFVNEDTCRKIAKLNPDVDTSL